MDFPTERFDWSFHPLRFLKNFPMTRPPSARYEKLPEAQVGFAVESFHEEGILPVDRPLPINLRPTRSRMLRVLAFHLVLLSTGALVYLIAAARKQTTNASSLQQTNLDSFQTIRIHHKGESHKEVQCDTPLEMVSGETEAHVVLWPSANSAVNISEYNGEKLRREKPGQLHGFWSLENAEYYPEVETARKELAAGDPKAFDFEVTYRTTSDFPIPYAYSFFDFRKRALPFDDRRQDKIAAAFISNCSPHNNRTDILKNLIELLPGQIDSFGNCLKNADSHQVVQQLNLNPIIPGKPHRNLSRWDEKMRIISKYKFTISFENANEEDYVTEKYYQALSAGSIPIHLGLTTDQFEKFKPSPNSALNVDDFKTVKELANRVKQISNDRITFESMLAWKNLPFAERFSEIVGWGKIHEACRIAKFLRKQWRNPHALKQERYNSFYERLNVITP
ncbi:hypothetical protein PCANC_22509 [Puccinia coronata f. sp. avenae]|uniref:Fucosyltransferase n=1 Tax=Puccinia coronata f. sp. avenae TaxID=200324 RepID=A0A2N5SI51_9BASI|nr:hypothetical protein PCANC_22509 [Puccinia coronata f. sp. avenae]